MILSKSLSVGPRRRTENILSLIMQKWSDVALGNRSWGDTSWRVLWLDPAKVIKEIPLHKERLLDGSCHILHSTLNQRGFLMPSSGGIGGCVGIWGHVLAILWVQHKEGWVCQGNVVVIICLRWNSHRPNCHVIPWYGATYARLHQTCLNIASGRILVMLSCPKLPLRILILPCSWKYNSLLRTMIPIR